MCFENTNKKDQIPFIDISGINSSSDFSKNNYYIKNLKQYFNNKNYFLSIISSPKKINSKSLSALKQSKIISTKNKYIPSRNNLLLAHPKITFKKQIYKKIKKLPRKSLLSSAEKKGIKNKKEMDIVHPKIEDEFVNNTYDNKNLKNINKITRNEYISPKKNIFPDYNKIKINKLKNKKAIFCSENYPGKNLMNIFDKINVNHDEEKADKNFSENKNTNKNIVEIKNRNSVKKILSLKINKRIKSYNHNVISLKKDYANINRIGNIKLYNISGIKTPYKTRKKSNNPYNKYKYNKWIKYHFNNKNIFAKTKNNNYENINRTFSYFSYNKKKLIFKNYK